MTHEISFRDDDIGFLTKLEDFKVVQDMFNRQQVKHTIALMAKDIEKNPRLIDYILANDIDVQLHCWEHIDLTTDHTKVEDQLRNGIHTIEANFNKRPTILYPTWNKTDAFIDRVAEDLGLKVSATKLSLSQYVRVNGDVKEDTVNFHYWHYGDLMFVEIALKIYNERQGRNVS